LTSSIQKDKADLPEKENKTANTVWKEGRGQHSWFTHRVGANLLTPNCQSIFWTIHCSLFWVCIKYFLYLASQIIQIPTIDFLILKN
jgi:hypothetical protein